jgi:AcrR family transcriptional regulator
MTGRLGPRARLLDAATRAIAREGYHGTSMRDLARATGRAPSSAYAHFRSKEEILFEIQSDAFVTLIDGAEQAVERETDPSRRLYAFILNHVAFFDAHPDLMRVLVHEAGALPPAHRSTIRALKERYFGLARGAIHLVLEFGRGAQRVDAADDVELERATYAFFGMLNWMYGWYDPKRHGPPEALARTIHSMAMRGAS